MACLAKYLATAKSRYQVIDECKAGLYDFVDGLVRSLLLGAGDTLALTLEKSGIVVVVNRGMVSHTDLVSKQRGMNQKQWIGVSKPSERLTDIDHMHRSFI